jgi:hypothetical protein
VQVGVEPRALNDTAASMCKHLLRAGSQGQAAQWIAALEGQVILRSFVRLGDDPDLATYKKYMNKQKWKKQKEAQWTLKKC